MPSIKCIYLSKEYKPCMINRLMVLLLIKESSSFLGIALRFVHGVSLMKKNNAPCCGQLINSCALCIDFIFVCVCVCVYVYSCALLNWLLIVKCFSFSKELCDSVI
jgi:hypothetical protein